MVVCVWVCVWVGATVRSLSPLAHCPSFELTGRLSKLEHDKITFTGRPYILFADLWPICSSLNDELSKLHEDGSACLCILYCTLVSLNVRVYSLPNVGHAEANGKIRLG